MAAGGIVTSPQLAVVGEVPEAVIPLSKLSDPRFRNAMGGGGGNAVVNMYVQAADPPAFKASQSQMMAQAAIAVGRAQQRNL